MRLTFPTPSEATTRRLEDSSFCATHLTSAGIQNIKPVVFARTNRMFRFLREEEVPGTVDSLHHPILLTSALGLADKGRQA